MERKRRVLVVDDENVVCTSFGRVLSEDGYVVNTVSDGLGAVEKIKQESFDIVFVDLRMPGIDGMEVVRNIRKTQPTIQVIIVTGYGTKESAREAATLGVSDFVPKPVTPERISSLAQKAWERRSRILDYMESESTDTEVPVKQEPPSVQAVPDQVPVKEKPLLREKEGQRPSLTKTLPLLVIGPLMGFAYVMFLPLIGFVMLFWLSGRKIYNYACGSKKGN